MVMANNNILLIEPAYRNKYPPLGLMKLAQYHGPQGKRDRVTFIKGPQREALLKAWDRVYVTTLFSFEYQKISEAIDFALDAVHGQANKVFVGGIAASLMTERFEAEPRWSGIRFIRGLLIDPPARSLQLDEFIEELYADDLASQPIEDLVPDYSILEQIEYKYPVRDAYFTYASRGCIRKCNFCGVPKLEGAQRDTESITHIVREIERLYGTKKDLILMDNNIVASPALKEIISEIVDLGFGAGATMKRGRHTLKRRVDFNQGVDARILCKDPMYMRQLSRIAIRPVRIAFDHWGLRAPYETSVRFAHEFGLDDLSNYMLYNFHETPTDLFNRMRLNVSLNEELGIRIYSFPMRFQPTNLPERSHIGEHWSRYQLRSMQIILQATHGVVSGAPDYFKLAFGDTAPEFEELLRRPHHFIFNREWFENGPGKPELEEYKQRYARLSESQRDDLHAFLSKNDPAAYRASAMSLSDSQIRSVVGHYFPPSKMVEAEIWAQRRGSQLPLITLGSDEVVEDAGLDEPVTPLELVAARTA
jgi:hypothetical protein